MGRILAETRSRAVPSHPPMAESHTPDESHLPMDEYCPPMSTGCDLSHCWWKIVLENISQISDSNEMTDIQIAQFAASIDRAPLSHLYNVSRIEEKKRQNKSDF